MLPAGHGLTLWRWQACPLELSSALAELFCEREAAALDALAHDGSFLAFFRASTGKDWRGADSGSVRHFVAVSRQRRAQCTHARHHPPLPRLP
jgi:hypothetical protein